MLQEIVSSCKFQNLIGDPSNVIGVIVEVNSDKKYKIGTRGGQITGWFERNAFKLTKFRGLKKEDVPPKENSLREIVRKLSIGTGQRFWKCSCLTTDCCSKRCNCYKEGLKCNSACHKNSEICKNHD